MLEEGLEPWGVRRGGRRVEGGGLRSGGCEGRWEVQRLDRDQIPQSLMGQCKDMGCVT